MPFLSNNERSWSFYTAVMIQTPIFAFNSIKIRIIKGMQMFLGKAQYTFSLKACKFL